MHKLVVGGVVNHIEEIDFCLGLVFGSAREFTPCSRVHPMLAFNDMLVRGRGAMT